MNLQFSLIRMYFQTSDKKGKLFTNEIFLSKSYYGVYTFLNF